MSDLTYCRTHNVRVCLYIAYIACGSASLYIKTLYLLFCTLALSAAATVANIKIRYDAKTPQLAIFGTRVICVFYSTHFAFHIVPAFYILQQRFAYSASGTSGKFYTKVHNRSKYPIKDSSNVQMSGKVLYNHKLLNQFNTLRICLWIFESWQHKTLCQMMAGKHLTSSAYSNWSLATYPFFYSSKGEGIVFRYRYRALLGNFLVHSFSHTTHTSCGYSHFVQLGDIVSVTIAMATVAVFADLVARWWFHPREDLAFDWMSAEWLCPNTRRILAGDRNLCNHFPVHRCPSCSLQKDEQGVNHYAAGG